MKRTPFVSNPNHKRLERSGKPMKRGKKSAKWDRIRAEIKVEFERMGVTRCEVCNGTFALSFAHRLKRRMITDDDELRMVALLCQSCHQQLDFGSHDAMFDKITAIIEGRE